MRVVATAGHVDHGKTTLLRALTGMEPDRLDQERRRGLTIDLGFVWTDLSSSDDTPITVAFVDVPGHRRFVPNMLAGAGTVSDVLFVVAADEGWSAQSREHLDILDLLAARGAAVVVTKADLVEPSRITEVVGQIRARTAGSFLADTPLVVIDAVTGRGLDDLRAVLATRLAATPSAADVERARLWVDRSFSLTGAGTVVTGTLAGGTLQTGQEVVLLPTGATARVRGLEMLGVTASQATPGSRVAVNLAGVARDRVRRGDMLVTDPEAWCVTDRVDALVRTLPDGAASHRGAWHLHAGTAHLTCTIHPVLDDLGPDEEGYARLELSSPLPLAHGDRLVIRDAGRQMTAAGATVLDPGPPARPRGTAGRLQHARSLATLAAATTPVEVVAAMLETRAGIAPRPRLVAAAGTTMAAITTAGERSVGPSRGATILALGDHLVTAATLGRWEEGVTTLVAASESPMPVELAVRRIVEDGAPAGLARLIVHELVIRRRLRRRGSVLLTPDQDADYFKARQQLQAAFIAGLADPMFSPPDPDGLASKLGVKVDEVQQLINRGALVRTGRVIFVGPAIDQAVTLLTEASAPDGRFTAAEAGRILGTTRKYTIPLLEHLARGGVTTFDGTSHAITHST